MKQTICFLVLCFFHTAVFGREMQAWYHIFSEKSLNIDWKLKTEFSARYGEDAHRPILYYYEADLTRNLPENWTASIGYRHLYHRVDRKWKLDPTPLAYFTKTWKIKNFSFADRNRIEYRTEAKKWLYRNRLQIRIPLYITRLKFQPLVSEEVFFMEKKGFEQNRLLAGLVVDQGSYYFLASYMFRSLKSSQNWRHMDVLYITLGASF